MQSGERVDLIISMIDRTLEEYERVLPVEPVSGGAVTTTKHRPMHPFMASDLARLSAAARADDAARAHRVRHARRTVRSDGHRRWAWLRRLWVTHRPLTPARTDDLTVGAAMREHEKAA